MMTLGSDLPSSLSFNFCGPFAWFRYGVADPGGVTQRSSVQSALNTQLGTLALRHPAAAPSMQNIAIAERYVMAPTEGFQPGVTGQAARPVKTAVVYPLNPKVDSCQPASQFGRGTPLAAPW